MKKYVAYNKLWQRSKYGTWEELCDLDVREWELKEIPELISPLVNVRIGCFYTLLPSYHISISITQYLYENILYPFQGKRTHAWEVY